MNKRTFFIQEYLTIHAFHGSVGNSDVEKVLLQNNITPIIFPHLYNFSIRAKLSRSFFLLKCFFTLPANSTILFQYPMYARMTRFLIRLLQTRKSIRLICFITDINGLKQGDDSLLQKEIQFFRRFSYFIVHNNAMQQWLRQQVGECRSSVINFFDFLTRPAVPNRIKQSNIVFAGNLYKSLFLEHLPLVTAKSPGLLFNIYGPNATGKMISTSSVQYKGVVEPYDLPAGIEGSFGLVWDGDGLDSPAGSFGNYMQYITHHKLSLYILSALPIIIYEHAGAAALVKQYGIGFTINSLFEIEEKINAVTAEDYERMVANSKKLAVKISSGKCLTEALQEILEEK